MRIARYADVDPIDAYAYPAEGTWVRANMVASVDGAATVDGRAGGLGNDTDRALFQLLRGLADVILVGAGTARAERYGPVERGDDWAKLRAGRTSVPPIALVTGTMDLDLDGPLFRQAPPDARTIVLTTQSAPEDRRAAAARYADVVVAGENSVSIVAVVTALAGRGYRRILCEGGPRLLAEVVGAGRLDELCLTVSPCLVAGHAPRVLNGASLPAPARLRPTQLLHDDEGYLFLQYGRTTASDGRGPRPGAGRWSASAR